MVVGDAMLRMAVLTPGPRTLLGVVCALALGAYAGRASAVTVDSADDSFTILFDGSIEGQTVPGLSASAFVDVQSLSGNTLVLDVTLTNTSSVLWNTSRVSAFGFDTGPALTSATLGSAVYSNVNLGGKLPNGFGAIDLCVINNANNCSGGGGGGLNLGESTVLTLKLAFDTPVRAVSLDNFGVRYQSLTSKELGFLEASGTGSPAKPERPIPEPASTALYLIGGLLVAAFVRRQLLTAR